MKARMLWTACVACLHLLSFIPGSHAADNGSARRATMESAKAEAAALLQKNDATGAYDLYMRLLREVPDDDGVNLGLARAATRAKHWNQAVLAYENLLEKHPREAVLYGELANVYMLLGDREAAERSLVVMRSLDGKTTKAETDKALGDMEERYSDFQIHGKVRAGILFDSNANQGPDSDNLHLGAWRVRVADARAKETFGAYLGADLDLGKRFFRDSPWWVVGDAQGFWRGNARSSLHDMHTRESQWGRAAVGVRHLTSSTLAELRFKAEIFDYELYQHVSAWGPEATLLWAITPSVHLIWKGGLDQRDYSRDDLRNGLYGWSGLYGRLFFGADKHEFLLGARYLGGSADRTDYGYDGWEGMARFLFKLPYGFELAPSVSYTEEYYKGPATRLETKDRKDERLRLGLGVTYRINEAWAVESNYQYTTNYSNSELYKYDQHYVSLGMVWNF